MEDIIVTESGLVYAVMVVEECATPDLAGAYNLGVDECPNCESNNTCIVEYPLHSCPYHPLVPHCYMWYCCDCMLLYEYKLVGDANETYNQAKDSQTARDSRIPTTD